MPIGFHHFYGCCGVRLHNCESRDYYYLGGFVGDHFNDEVFKSKLDKVIQLLKEKYGFGHFVSCWSPVESKPYKPRTPQQCLSTALKKAQNKTDRNIRQIKKGNSLFVNDFIMEEQQKLFNRQEALKRRYEKLSLTDETN